LAERGGPAARGPPPTRLRNMLPMRAMRDILRQAPQKYRLSSHPGCVNIVAGIGERNRKTTGKRKRRHRSYQQMGRDAVDGKTGSRAGDSRAQRAAIRREYKERTKQPGVFRVVNAKNGRVLLGSGLDLRGPLNRVAFELDMAMCWNADMKQDLETHGRDSFLIEVLEKVQLSDDPDFDPENELETLEQKYLEQLDWSTAYNKDRHIRYPS